MVIILNDCVAWGIGAYTLLWEFGRELFNNDIPKNAYELLQLICVEAVGGLRLSEPSQNFVSQQARSVTKIHETSEPFVSKLQGYTGHQLIHNWHLCYQVSRKGDF